MKPKDMKALCEYLESFEGIDIIANCTTGIVILDYFGVLSVTKMDDLGCDWEPSMGGFRMRDDES